MFKKLLVSAVIIALASAITFPLVFNLKSAVYGYPSDLLSVLATFREIAAGKAPLTDRNVNQILFRPVVGLLSKAIGGIAAHNTFFLAALVLGVLTCHRLTKKVTDSNLGAWLAGMAYGFSLYNLWHGMQNLEIIMGVAWLPLYVLALVRFAKTLHPVETGHAPSLPRAALLAALAFALVFLTSFYIGFFAILFTIGFFLLNLLKELSTALRRTVESPKCLPNGNSGTIPTFTTTLHSIVVRLYRTAKQPALRFIVHCSLFAVFCFVFTLPGTYPLFRYHLNPQDLSPQSQSIRQTMELRQSDEVIAYGARPWDYLTPSIFHPVYGKYVEPFYQWLEKTGGDFRFISPYLPERVNYIPITILILAGYAVFRSTREVLRNRRSKNPKSQAPNSEHTNVFMFALLALWMFAVSMPAFFFVGPIRIYFPSHYLFKFLPMFRIYARAGIFVLLCAAVLAAYGLKFLLARRRDGACPVFTKILIPIIFGLILFENLNFPPFHLLDLSKTPAVYTWLAEQPAELTIVDYPRDMEPGGGCTPNVDPEVRKDFCPSCGLYFQTIHQKALFTGDSLEPNDRQTISDLANPQTHQILSANGVNLVIVHTADPFPQKNPLDSCQSRRIMEKPEKVAAGLKLIEKFEGAVVYEVLP